MKKIYFFGALLCAAFQVRAQQVALYDFTQDPLQTGWTSIHNNNTQGSGQGVFYNSGSNNVEFNVETGTGYNILHRTLPTTLQDQFSVSFEITLTGPNSSTFFPLLLTPNALPASDPHPWRHGLFPQGQAGGHQNLDLLGVTLNGREPMLVNRVGTSAVVTPFSQPLQLGTNRTYYIRLEKVCENTVLFGVYLEAAMIYDNTSLEREEYITINPIADMNELYIANGNGNFVTDQNGFLDNYAVTVTQNTCCSPSGIAGPLFICDGASSPATFTAGVSGTHVLNPTWTVSPAGPVYTETTSNGYELTVSDWGQPGTYTITFTWTCNCVTQTLTHTVVVYDISEEDSLTLQSSCGDGPNTHDFTVTSNGTNPSIVRSWEIYQAANLNYGDYTTTGTPLFTYGNQQSISVSNMPNAMAFVIVYTHQYENGACPPEVIYKKSVCASSRMSENSNLFPNPVSNELNVKLPEELEVSELKVIGMNGEVVLQQKTDGNSARVIKLDTSKLKPGSYTVLFVSRGQNSEAGKFIKE